MKVEKATYGSSLPTSFAAEHYVKHKCIWH